MQNMFCNYLCKIMRKGVCKLMSTTVCGLCVFLGVDVGLFEIGGGSLWNQTQKHTQSFGMMNVKSTETNSGLKNKSLPEEWGVLPDWLVSGVSMWFALTDFPISALNNAVVWGGSEFVANGCHTPRIQSYSPPTVYAHIKHLLPSYKSIFLIYTNKYTMWKPPF